MREITQVFPITFVDDYQKLKKRNRADPLENNLSKSHSGNTSFIILFLSLRMGEAKRRKELGLPPKAKKERKTKPNENMIPWSQFSINKLKSQYPAAPIASTALFLIVLQWGSRIIANSLFLRWFPIHNRAHIQSNLFYQDDSIS